MLLMGLEQIAEQSYRSPFARALTSDQLDIKFTCQWLVSSSVTPPPSDLALSTSLSD